MDCHYLGDTVGIDVRIDKWTISRDLQWNEWTQVLSQYTSPLVCTILPTVLRKGQLTLSRAIRDSRFELYLKRFVFGIGLLGRCFVKFFRLRLDAFAPYIVGTSPVDELYMFRSYAPGDCWKAG
ncbi:hypothetical protein AG1IA_08716 [Rhizoctonia solani AG-1 IA]|uniref:Uncharacterized protein n=1 Tax=Thanatephorus cucumeris (strain AG1-IA) TaxID=983506 RepID=L8WGE0_THACA|nr:hypothetical protein AG1IA_08716 [Rhizoctonia solani AG-1 IA]